MVMTQDQFRRPLYFRISCDSNELIRMNTGMQSRFTVNNLRINLLRLRTETQMYNMFVHPCHCFSFGNRERERERERAVSYTHLRAHET